MAAENVEVAICNYTEKDSRLCKTLCYAEEFGFIYPEK